MKILFVDDERRKMERWVDELKDNKYEVQFEDNVDSALATLENPNNHFDLLVLDISMPAGETFKFADTRGGTRTGVPLYDKIRRLRPDLKVVALTNVVGAGLTKHFEDDEERNLCRIAWKPDYLPFRFAEMVGEFLNEN